MADLPKTGSSPKTTTGKSVNPRLLEKKYDIKTFNLEVVEFFKNLGEEDLDKFASYQGYSRERNNPKRQMKLALQTTIIRPKDDQLTILNKKVRFYHQIQKPWLHAGLNEFPLDYDIRGLRVGILKIFYRGKERNGSWSRETYSIRIPNVIDRNPRLILNPFDHGQWFFSWLLGDGSFVRGWFGSESQAQEFYKDVKSIVDRRFWGEKPKIELRKHKDIKKLKLYPRYAKYYPKGAIKGEPPKWVLYF